MSLGRVLRIISFYFGYANVVSGIRGSLTSLLGSLMFNVSFPTRDRLLARPIRNRNTKTIPGACALNAQEARLFCGELLHVLSHVAVSAITLAPERSKDHCVVRWVGSLRDRIGHMLEYINDLTLCQFCHERRDRDNFRVTC